MCTTRACPEHGDVKPVVKSRAQQFLESQPGSRFSRTAKSETGERSREERVHTH